MIGQDQLDLGGFEADHVDREVELDELAELEGEELPVPLSLLGQLVVGEDVGAFLVLAHVVELDAGDFAQSKKRGGPDPAVPGQDRALAVDQHGVGKAERVDAVGDLADLLLGVRASIACPGSQRGDGALLDGELADGWHGVLLPMGFPRSHPAHYDLAA